MTTKNPVKPHSEQTELRSASQLRMTPLGLSEATIKQNVALLNQIVDDSRMIYDLYKKHHWQIAGPTFYSLHLLFDKHAEEIEHTIDELAERVQALGGIVQAMPRDVVAKSKIEPAPGGEETASAMLKRLLNAHAMIIQSVREAIEVTEKNKDYGSNDLLVSDVLRLHELQVWFINQHLVEMTSSW
jgi:starvation-inducible DNA-binding protein